MCHLWEQMAGMSQGQEETVRSSHKERTTWGMFLVSEQKGLSNHLPDVTWRLFPQKVLLQWQKVFQGGVINTVRISRVLWTWYFLAVVQKQAHLQDPEWFSHMGWSPHSAFHREGLPECLILLSFWIVRSLFSPSSCGTACHFWEHLFKNTALIAEYWIHMTSFNSLPYLFYGGCCWYIHTSLKSLRDGDSTSLGQSVFMLNSPYSKEFFPNMQSTPLLVQPEAVYWCFLLFTW